MVLIILVSSSAKVAIFEFFSALEDGFHIGGTIEDQELILEVPLMSLGLLSTLHQEWLFAGIDLSDKTGTIVECLLQPKFTETME